MPSNDFQILTKSILTRSAPIGIIALSMTFIFIISTTVKEDFTRTLGVSTMILIVLIATSVEMYVYLQTSRRKFPRSSAARGAEELPKITSLERQVRALREYVENIPAQAAHDVFTKDEKERIQKDLLSKLGERTVSDLAKKLLETTAKIGAMDAHMENARATAKHMLERLEDEVSDLGKRANINLLIGIGVSVVGVIVLIWFVFSLKREDIVPENEKVLAFYIASRLSLVLFIEVFAYFFLRLYRYGIFEIKYFQNEITNAEFRLIALEAAFRSGDADAVKKACIEMSKVERNFILKKGETTLALKRDEIEQGHDKSVISILERILAAKASDKDKGAHSASAQG